MNFNTKETLIGLQCLGLEFAMLDILTQDEFKFSKEDLGL